MGPDHRNVTKQEFVRDALRIVFRRRRFLRAFALPGRYNLGMKTTLTLLVALLISAAAAAQDKTAEKSQDFTPQLFVEGLKNPESVAVGFNRRVFASEIGEFGKDGDGRIVEITGGKITPFATGLDDPKGLVVHQKWMYVNDKDRVIRIDGTGKTSVFVGPDAFPAKPLFLNDIAVDETGALIVTDTGDLKGNLGALYRIDQKGKVTTVTNSEKLKTLKMPNGVTFDGTSFALLGDFANGDVYRVSMANGAATKIISGAYEGLDGMAWDHWGRLYISSWKQGKVWVMPRPGKKLIELPVKFESAADLCLDPSGKFLLVPDMKAGKVFKVPTGVPGEPVDERPLSITSEVAFPKLKWTGWESTDDSGKVVPMRPIFLTHAGDGSNRVFVTLQHGPIHVFPNDQNATETKVFLDLTKKVLYTDKENEQGLLGLAFHPKFKENGEFFVFYTERPKSPSKAIAPNIVSRFKVKKDNPNEADPASEEELLRINRPFWNHDGGTIAFGPDGYLYIALGDGGAANDPFKNGQKLSTLLGKILRIDVDKKDPGLAYAIPMDNPFVGVEGARGEVWAYGLRNPWRIAFDRKTGKLYAGEVGQNLYEEIVIVEKGGNYGWSKRESFHPFGPDGLDVNAKMIEPIWEYHHDVGRSITGGNVYRGKRLPELNGAYLYGDYVSNKLWALWYDEAKGRVVANRPIADRNQLIFSFGEDENGDVYYMTQSLDGRGIYRFVPAAK
jgi:glucose/arabinose dehydrogenase